MFNVDVTVVTWVTIATFEKRRRGKEEEEVEWGIKMLRKGRKRVEEGKVREFGGNGR